MIFFNIKYILCLNVGWILTFSARYLDALPLNSISFSSYLFLLLSIYLSSPHYHLFSHLAIERDNSWFYFLINTITHCSVTFHFVIHLENLSMSFIYLYFYYLNICVESILWIYYHGHHWLPTDAHLNYFCFVQSSVLFL